MTLCRPNTPTVHGCTHKLHCYYLFIVIFHFSHHAKLQTIKCFRTLYSQKSLGGLAPLCLIRSKAASIARLCKGFSILKGSSLSWDSSFNPINKLPSAKRKTLFYFTQLKGLDPIVIAQALAALENGPLIHVMVLFCLGGDDYGGKYVLLLGSILIIWQYFNPIINQSNQKRTFQNYSESVFTHWECFLLTASFSIEMNMVACFFLKIFIIHR